MNILWRCFRYVFHRSDPLCRWERWELRDGVWHGPHGERLRAISGAQDELLDFAADLGSGAEASSQGGNLATGQYAGGFTPPTPPDSSSLTDFASNLGTNIGKGWDWLTKGTGKEGQPTQESPLSSFSKLLGIGATGLGVANQFNVQGQLGQQTKRLNQAQAQAESAAAPAVVFGTETLNRAAGGQLTPALQAGIDQWVQQKKADARSRLASMGLGNSTDLDSIDRLIDQQAEAMVGQLLQQQEETGLAGLQTGVSAATGVSQSSQQQQGMLANLIAQANQALGKLGGVSS